MGYFGLMVVMYMVMIMIIEDEYDNEIDDIDVVVWWKGIC